MKNEIILKRKIKVEKWQVIAIIAKAEPRDELLPILKRLQELDVASTDDIDYDSADNIAEHLFFDNKARLIVVKRMLEICRLYGLVEKERKNYQLTIRGNKAVDEKKVFVPEEGTWKIEFSDDPLLPFPIISIESFKEPAAQDEIFKRDKREFEKIPESIKKSKEIEHSPCLGGEKIIISVMEEKGEKISLSQDLLLEWDVTKKTIRLEDNELPIDYSDTRKKIWQSLLEQKELWKNWDENDEKLKVVFDKLKDSAKNSMRDDILFEAPKINKYGVFDNFTAEGVDLKADSKESAQSWAKWRLEHSINNFATTKNYEKWSKEAKEPFEDFTINLPEREELAKNLKGKERVKKDWFVLAASDWNL